MFTFIRSKAFIISMLLIVGVGFFYYTYSCLPASSQKQRMGTHGWEIWSGASYLSFSHSGKRYCIPAGWEPLGSIANERGGATFEKKSTGVFIKSDEFSKRYITVGTTTMTVVYPKTLTEAEADEYLKIINNSFRLVTTLYPLQTLGLPNHTVFISVGIAGDGGSFGTSIYPQASPLLSVFVKNRTTSRSEELYLHTSTHVYNRFSPYSNAYASLQYPLSSDDWQETEATWSEIIFLSNTDARNKRVLDLYSAYIAVQKNEFSETLKFPFNQRSVFNETKRHSVLVPEDHTYGEEQFGHYTLAPLFFLSIEGLLEKDLNPVSVNQLLIEVHNTNANFFDLLAVHLPEESVQQSILFMTGQEVIPYELIELGMRRHQNTVTID